MTERTPTPPSSGSTVSKAAPAAWPASRRKTAPAAKSPAARSATPRTAKPAPDAAKAPRRTKLGDITGSQLPKRIAKLAVATQVNARQQTKFAAVRDVLAKPQASKADKANSLRAILEGAAPDDVKALRRLLKEDAVVIRGKARDSATQGGTIQRTREPLNPRGAG